MAGETEAEHTLEWINEDELPEGYPYDRMFPLSKLGHDGLGGVRIFPKVVPWAAMWLEFSAYDSKCQHRYKSSLIRKAIRKAEGNEAMKSYEEVSLVFETAVEQSVKNSASYLDGVRQALGWVLEEYDESPIDEGGE